MQKVFYKNLLQYFAVLCVKFFNLRDSHEEEGREKIPKGNVKHVFLYSEPVQYCKFNIFSDVYVKQLTDRCCFLRH